VLPSGVLSSGLLSSGVLSSVALASGMMSSGVLSLRCCHLGVAIWVLPSGVLSSGLLSSGVSSSVPEFRDHFGGRKSADLSVNPLTSDFTITLNPVGMYSLYTVVSVDTKYISEFTVSQNVSYIFKNLAKFR
jgi:hypothetical protein